ncbi:1,5-anhydro-D-fructose reductase [Paenibacillus polymyxa E681]|uniref:Gfo/Idh/MocA family protein n=1 Tax=Paenibacillus polymyxa TaxID=1406 RepID=UPI0001E31705|nr:Gfo/Idh/MocA family oxidoreductase [Paenibacillus polymyxa]ADM68713.1 dehydrogenase [Paenibacillus polymyxa E681]QNV55719.1 1,5-anhydro-D-fructose reductase [Paenibacillus polymyxa E681]QNV60555.1 1,5-anhydro-D-fructose reductase [Paenibacillus polymyxa E681]
MKKLRAGIIGAGFIGPAHIEAIRRLGFVDVVALAGSNLESSCKHAAELNIPLAYGSYKEMLANPDIDVIHNCTPNHVHFSINMEAIAAGKHILSEKPLAMTSKESAELLKAAQDKGIVHAVNYNYRQYPLVQQMASMVRGGELGQILVVHGSYMQDWLMYETDYNWRMNPEIGGKSRAIADIGSHWCDTAQFVLNKKITAVFADLVTIYPVRKKAKQPMDTYEVQKSDAEYEDVDIETEDYATVIVRFEDGTRGTFTVSQVSAGRKNQLVLELDGSVKAVSWNQEQPEQLWIGQREKSNEVLKADANLLNKEAQPFIHYPSGHNEGWPDALKNIMSNFYQFIRDEKKIGEDQPAFATFADGHSTMCIIDAILKSYAEQRWVEVEEVLS